MFERFRVLGAEALEEARAKADEKKYDEAKEILEDFKEEA